MNFYKVILILLSIVLFIHGYRGLVAGRIYVKGMYVNRDKNPIWFWVSEFSIFIFAIVLFIFAFMTKYR